MWGACASGDESWSIVPSSIACDLPGDGDQGVAEPVELGDRLGLGRLHHQGAGDGERHGRRVEPVVDEPLGDVVDGDAGAPGDVADVEDALVRDPAGRARVEDGVVVGQAGGDVVGVQDRDRGRIGELRAQHADVGPRDRQDPGGPERRRRHRPRSGRRSGVGAQRVVGQERGEVRPDGDRPDTRAAAAVGDAEGLVQVEVAHVGPEPSGLGDADERVEVGAVEVHLPTGVVDQLADVPDARLEHAVGRGVGDHERSQRVAVLTDLRGEVVGVDVAVVVTGDDHDPHAGHDRRRGVGAVGRRGDEAHGPGVVAARAVVGGDGDQTGELALGAGVGLERDGLVAGDLHQPRFELVDEDPVAGGVGSRRERVHVREPRTTRSAPSRLRR